MMLSRWLSLGCVALAASLAPSSAVAQLAPTGGHYSGRASDTGFQGEVNSSGGYHASVPLDLPAARGGLPVPVQIVYTERGVGAAGLGWDVPLSYIRDNTTLAHRRPKNTPGAAPQARRQVSVVIDGRRIGLVRTASAWVAQRDAPDLEVRELGGGWVMFDGQGHKFSFTSPSSALAGTGIWLLTDITGAAGSQVHLDYTIAQPSLPGASTVAIDLATVSYNPNPTTVGCYKNAVDLAYESAAGAPLSMTMVGSKVLVRTRRLFNVSVSGKANCGGSGDLLRKYQFSYQDDVDTAQPRLKSVALTGRAGTPEAATPITVAFYAYGSLSNGGPLSFQTVASLPAGLAIGSTIKQSPGPFGLLYRTNVMFNDITGDGRPDRIALEANGNLSIQRNTSSASVVSFNPAVVLPTDVMTPPRAPEDHTLSANRYPVVGGRDMTWVQFVDMNGDGRLDLVDALTLDNAWIVYLNTPDPSNPEEVRWAKRTLSTTLLRQQLFNRGMTVDPKHVPLAQRTTARDTVTFKCWMFLGGFWTIAKDSNNCPGGWSGLKAETSYTEWELGDINGDGYPDVVFNSSPVVATTETVPFPDDPAEFQKFNQATLSSQQLSGGDDNRVEAMLNVMGVGMTDFAGQPFSAPITVLQSSRCGVDLWRSTEQDTFKKTSRRCGFEDVNGDGIPDRIDDQSVALGTGNLVSGSAFTGGLISLPGALAIHQNLQTTTCGPLTPTNTTFGATGLAGLRDVTGDGIPDYLSSSTGDSWTVVVGTGAGFGKSLPVSGSFVLSAATENCGGSTSTTTSGLFDVDGDGKPDVVQPGGSIAMLFGSNNTRGAPEAGRLVRIENGYGARTTIQYRSIKGDSGTLHQIPFPEVVVDSVTTAGTKSLGGDLAATRYAYGGAELLFDPVGDDFLFPGYRRTLELPTPIAQPAGVATFTITDRYAPVSALDPYGVSGAMPNLIQRYKLYLRTGRVRDITTFSGDFGAAALATPSQLLALNASSDGRRIAATHHDWDARLLSAASDPPAPEPCMETVFPYDAAASAFFDGTIPSYDPCKAHGFAFEASVQSWRGAPGAAPPSPNNVETRADVVTVDDLGRTLKVKQFNDVHRDDDDVCVDTTYAVPTGANERVLFAPATRSVSACNATILAREFFEYDSLAAGSVSTGLVTSHLVDRRDDAGALIGTIRQFEATYDAAGNLKTVSSTREDGATRTVTTSYDPFGLVPTSIAVTSPTTPTLQTSIERDPVTLSAMATTDPGGSVRGATFDGFDRPILSTFTPPGGAKGVLSVLSYLGFTGDDPAGRRVVRKIFTDAVAPGTEASVAGRSATAFLDELGRTRRTELALGADYQNQVLVIGSRTYDGLGRVVFAANPFAVTPGETPSPSYGTTYYFNADGTPSCTVQGVGQQPFTQATDESTQIFPTCFARAFENSTEVVSVQDASSLLAGSPQAGVKRTGYATAIGRAIARSTWQGSTRLEHAVLAYDRLGRRISMTRYKDASGATQPVTSTWRFDSLGQVVQLDEPDSVPQFSSYSNWGELTAVTRTLPSQGTTLRVRSTYDAYSRLIHQEQARDNDVDAATAMDYQYDTGVSPAPQVTATHVLGRMALATSPTGSVAFSYDALGRINARVFTDPQGGLYVEKHTAHADGSPAALDLFLPDTGYAQEHVAYDYNSAGYGTSVTYANGSDTANLFTEADIDPFGRATFARYGQALYVAVYDTIFRPRLVEAGVSSSFGERTVSFTTLDPSGRERSRWERRTGRATITTNTSYDALGRLSRSVQRTAQDQSNAVVFDQGFSYDALGNITSIVNPQLGSSAARSAASGPTNPSATTTTLSYLDTDRDRICRIAYNGGQGTGCNVTYDEVGSITSQQTATGLREYGYYIDGSVRSISDSAGSEAGFRYDAFGEVQELDVTSPTSLDVRRDRRYGGLLAWRSVTGLAPSSVLSRKIPGPHGLVATRRGAGGPWLFEFGEARGTRFVVDQNGAFVQDIDYEPFGAPNSTGAQPGSSRYSNEQWNGGDALAAFGVSHLGARLYDPAIGRFLSRDPLLIPRTAVTTNPYAFAANDPANSSDPSGMFKVIDSEFGLVENSDGVWVAVPLGGDAAGDSQVGKDTYGLDTTFSNSPPIVWSVGSSGSQGVKGSSGGATQYTGAFSWTLLYDRQTRATWDEVFPGPVDNEGVPIPGAERGPIAHSSLLDDTIEGITDVFADAFAKTANGIFEVNGAQHPSHAEAVTQVRPAVHSVVSISINVQFMLLLAMLAPEGEVAEGMEALATRANEVHQVLDPIAQAQRTTCVLRTSGGNIIAGGARDLSPAQRALLGPGEIAAKLPGVHAELTALQHAAGAGLTPQAIAVTRIICPLCAAAIEASGGRLTSPTTAVWP